MKAEELRIGNYVSSLVNNRPQMKVLQLFGDSFQGDFGDSSRGGIMYENTEGIPITEKWLDEFGFRGKKVYEAVFEWRIGETLKEHRIQTDGEVFVWTDYKDGIEIKFVHQLQNLYFALTQEELTISEPTKP